MASIRQPQPLPPVAKIVILCSNGDSVSGSILATTETQRVTGARVAAGAAAAAYFAGTVKTSPTATGNIILFQRLSGFYMGWNRTLDTAPGADDFLTHLVADARPSQPESVYVAGISRLGGVNRWFLAKYASNGAFQYVRIGENNTAPSGLAIDASGDVYLSYGLLTGGVQQTRLVKHTGAGVFAWRTGYNPTTTANVGFADISVSGSHVGAVGFVQASATVMRPMAAIFNLSGTRVASEVKTTVDGFYRKSLPAGPDAFYAVGTQRTAGPGLISAKYEASGAGTPAWFRKATPGATHVPEAIDAATDAWNNLYLVGNTTRPEAAGNASYFVKYNASGTAQWTFLNSATDEFRESNALMVHPQTGQVWAAGRHYYSGFQQIFMSQLSQPAVVVADSFSMARNTTLTGNVNLNDRYWAGTTALVSTAPTGGGLTLNADGSFSYTPPTGFTGTKTFTYRMMRAFVSDSNVAAVTITVN